MRTRSGRQIIGVALSCGFLVAVALVAGLSVRAARIADIPVVPIVAGAEPAAAVPRPVHGVDLPHEHAAALLHPPPGGRIEGAECGCEAARQIDGWCPACGVGYVAGTAVPSAMLFDALDPHGHAIMPTSLECDRCQEALESDGFCEDHGWGFARGLLYASRLTWGLACGSRSVSVCGDACVIAGAPGWCDVGGHGRIGLRGVGSRAVYAATTVELDRLRLSIDALERCETCALRDS